MISLDRLRAKVRETADTFPWYRDIVGREPDAIRSVAELPLMTAELLEAHYYCRPDDPSLTVYRTSGTSSGRRKSIAYSAEDDNHYIEAKTKLFGELLAGSGSARALADIGTGHAADTALAIFRRLGLEARSVSYELPIERHIEALRLFRPDVLYTMPSIADRIAHGAAELARTFGIRRIILVGEIAAPQWQRQLAGRFGLEPRRIVDTYGSIEIGTIACYRHDIGRYVLADGLHAEGIGTESLGGGFDPLGDNESVLTLTSFVRRMFPAVRFVTYDVVRDLRPVTVDGEPRMSFRSIVKRVGRELKHGEKISLYDIEQAVYRHVSGAIVRVGVTDNALAIRLAGAPGIGDSLPAIREDIRNSIPEIGAMIRNGLLRDIEVSVVQGDGTMPGGRIKGKKLYYSQE